jgi:hypothetical protein
MVRRFSSALGSTPAAFKKAGGFDGFVEVDTKLYIDPHLLSFSSAPEIREAALYFRQYFEDLIHILKHIKSRNSPFWREAVRKLTFPEIRQLSLGYSTDTTSGNAIGHQLAGSIAETARQIVEAGIEEPEIFELIGVLEEGIGADRISDMTARVILEHLLRYSQRIAADLSLSRKALLFREVNYQMPFDPKTKQYIILIPNDILRQLPVAHVWSDIDFVCEHNEALRRKVNRLIGYTWRNATTKVSKRELREVLLSNPGALQDLLEQYRGKIGQSYDFDSDPAGEIEWYKAAHEFSDKYPLDLTHFGKVTARNVNVVVQAICARFKQLVENNGLYHLFYNDSGRLKHERAAQLLFFGVADAYCEANDLDLNREPNAGRGPVGFKLSRGYKARVNVEMKYTSSPHLVDGYATQLPTYNQSEKTLSSIFLIIRTGDHEKNLKSFMNYNRKLFRKASVHQRLL